MAKPTKYDVMWEGKKVGGGAQRRTKYGFLHQGTISLGRPDEEFLSGILLDKELLSSFIQNSFHPERAGNRNMEENKLCFKQAMLHLTFFTKPEIR
jgi:lipoate-protein ligase A